jgi:hypothetical protein
MKRFLVESRKIATGIGLFAVWILAIVLLFNGHLWYPEAHSSAISLYGFRKVSHPDLPSGLTYFPDDLANPLPTDLSVRPAGAVEGPFQISQSVGGQLWLVRDGAMEQIGGILAGRSPGRVGLPKYHWMAIHFGIGESNQDVRGHRHCAMWCRGFTRAFGRGWHPHPVSFSPLYWKTIVGPVTPDKAPQVLYIEGDREPKRTDCSSIEEFAGANPGNFLVITVNVTK